MNGTDTVALLQEFSTLISMVNSGKRDCVLWDSLFPIFKCKSIHLYQIE